MRWRGFLATVLGYYFAVNVVFGVLFPLQPGRVTELPTGSAVAAFFFSIETFATVGYGVLAPQTLYAHGVATLEIFAGLLSTGMITGLLIVRFARPRSALVFSRPMRVAPYDGVPVLMHPLDESSPLHGMTPERLAELNASFVVSVAGADATLAVPVTAMQDCEPAALLWGYRFADTMGQDAGGRTRILLARLRDVVAV